MGSLSSGVAGALAVMVDDDDGQVVADCHLLEGGVDLRHLVGVHLVGAAVDTAEGVDEDDLAAQLQHGGLQVLQPAGVECPPAEGEVEIAVGRGAHLLEAVLQAAGRVLGGEVEHADLLGPGSRGSCRRC